MEPEGSMSHIQGFSNKPYLEQNKYQFLVLKTIYLIFILMLSSHQCPGLSRDLVLQVCLLNFLKHSYLLPFWLHAQPILIIQKLPLKKQFPNQPRVQAYGMRFSFEKSKWTGAHPAVDEFIFLRKRPLRKEKYRSTDNTKIGIKIVNSYGKN